MPKFEIEHINLTVANNEAFAQALMDLFSWKVVWQGRGMEGTSILVGSGSTYLALYTPDYPLLATIPMYQHDAAMNHIGIVTDDLHGARSAILAKGFAIHEEIELAPTKRLYFFLQGVEIEVAQ